MRTIAFLDLTGGKDFDLTLVKQLTIDDMLTKIKEDTGRELRIRFEESLASIGIVKYDPPIGYALFANADIKKNQPLFYYGGEVVEENINNKSTYILPLDIDEIECGVKLTLDAAHYGDLGALAMHLPDQNELDPMKIEQQRDSVLSSNISRQTKMGDRVTEHDVMFFADKATPRGTIFGYSYSLQYWTSHQMSPLLMAKNGNPIHDLKVHDPLICFKDYHGDGNLLYRYSDIRDNFPESNELDFSFTIESNGDPFVVYLNKNSVGKILRQIELSGPSEKQFYIIAVKNISQEVQEALQRGENKINLRLSIFATKKNPQGPYADAYVSEGDGCQQVEIPEDIAQMYGYGN